MINKKQIPVMLAVLIIVFTLLLYKNTFKHDYTYDDYWVIVNNKFVQSGVNGIGKIMTSTFWEGIGSEKLGYFRPVPLITFALEDELDDNNPGLAHVINVILYGLCGILLYFFLVSYIFPKNHLVSFICSILFISHPVHTEAVASIKSREEILCLLGMLASLFSALRYIDTKKIWYFLLSLIAFILALLSKEHAVVLIVLIPISAYIINGKINREDYQLFATYPIIILIYLLYKWLILGSVIGPVEVDYLTYPYRELPLFTQKIPTLIVMMIKYIQLLIVPYPLIYDYSFNQFAVRSITDISYIVSLIGAVFLVSLAIRETKKKTIAGFAITFFLITISVPLSFTLLKGGIMAERFLFIPSVAYCILLAMFFKYFLNKNATVKYTACIASVLLISCFSMITVSRNLDWKDNITLYRSNLKHCEENARVYYNLGTVLVNDISVNEQNSKKRNELLDEAIGYLIKSIKIFYDNSYAQNNLGKAYAQKENWVKAAEHYARAINIKNDHMYAYNNLGNAYIALKAPLKAIEVFEKALEMGFSHYVFFNNMGLANLSLKRYGQAEKDFKNSIKLNPNSIKPYKNLVYLYKLTGNTEAANSIKKALKGIENP